MSLAANCILNRPIMKRQLGGPACVSGQPTFVGAGGGTVGGHTRTDGMKLPSCAIAAFCSPSRLRRAPPSCGPHSSETRMSVESAIRDIEDRIVNANNFLSIGSCDKALRLVFDANLIASGRLNDITCTLLPCENSDLSNYLRSASQQERDRAFSRLGRIASGHGSGRDESEVRAGSILSIVTSSRLSTEEKNIVLSDVKRCLPPS